MTQVTARKARSAPKGGAKDDTAGGRPDERPFDPDSFHLEGIDEDTIVATSIVGSFQITKPRSIWHSGDNEEIIPGITLEFDSNHQVVIEDDVAKMIDEIVAGTFKHKQAAANPKHMQAMAIDDKLQVLRPGLVPPPGPTWDSIDPSRVVQTALDAGWFRTVDDAERAFIYERQTGKRTKGQREARPEVLSDLKRCIEDFKGIHDTGLPADRVEL